LLQNAGYRGYAEILAQTTHSGTFHDAGALNRVADYVASFPER
jgi:hypothetical protein